VLPTPCFVLSDAHLGAAPAAVEATVVSFLHRRRGQSGSLIINGDLFDFWFEWQRAMPRGAVRVLAAIAALRDAGMPVVWLAGNHDCWGGDILRREIGVDYQPGPWRGRIGAWQSFVHHGDGMRGERDRGYRRTQRFLRSAWAINAFRLLPADWSTRLALATSHTSRQHNVPDDGAPLREAAFAVMRDAPDTDLVVFGHSHRSGLARAATGGVYGNPGAWLDAPTYLRIDDTRVSLVRDDGSAEGDCLDVLDRVARAGDVG
jgi:UDP-2,3-diacylglucosamine hydrolase